MFPLFGFIYSILPQYTMLVHVYLYFPIFSLFTYIYPHLVLFTLIYLYLPLIALIWPYIPYSPYISPYISP